MQQVEVVDDDHLLAAADGPRVPVRRRRWAEVLLVVVLALVCAQLAVTARDRSVSARLAQLPGVLHAVDPDVGELWRVDDADREVVTEGAEVGGVVVGVRTGRDGAQSVVALDVQTGQDRWSTPLTDADAVLAQRGGRSSTTSCAPVPGEQERVACLVSDAVVGTRPRGSLTLTRPPSASRVVVIDIADGRVVADHPAPAALRFAVLPGLVVVAAPGRDGHAEVTAQDLLTGEVRWHHTSPPTEQDLTGDAAGDVAGFGLLALDGLVAVVEASSVTLLDADGTVARERERFDRLTRDGAGTRLEVLSGYLAFRPVTSIVRPGRPDRHIPGRLVQRAVDDGSLPSVELVEGSRIQGRDALTGEGRWQADQDTIGPVLVLRGLVYCTSGDGAGEVVAIDGRTGTVVWSVEVGTYDQRVRLMTDGRVLLVTLTPEVGTDAGSITAFSLDDGERLWRVPLPGGLDAAWAQGHLLVAGSGGEPAVSVVLGSS